MMGERTLAEQMAIAILKGDMVAAYALADKLLEQRDGGVDKLATIARGLRDTSQAYDGYTVYHWPEFQAFCKRAGILWDLRTISITFKIAVDERLVVEHLYAGSNDNRQPVPVDTTTIHN